MQAISLHTPALQQQHERGLRLILLVLAAILPHGQAYCQEALVTVADNISLPGAIEIEGDSLQLRIDRQLHASGNAVIKKGKQTITGDDIRYDLQNDELLVEGNARINADQTEIKGPVLRMRLSENIGEMRDVSIEFKTPPPPPGGPSTPPALLSDQAIFISDPKKYLDDNQSASNLSRTSPFSNARGTASMVLFEGQDKKSLKQAKYTTCAANVDDWYIKAGKLELNDYSRTGVASNAIVEFKGVPILYSPWMSFSYNNQRKSGFLSPLIGTTSRSGFEILTPYYFNIRPDMDATLATRYLSKRGLQVQGEFRYLDEHYTGLNNVEYLDSDVQTGQQRYYAKLTHKQQFSEHWTGGYNFEKVSDDRYFSEMSTRIVVTSRVNLQQEAFLKYQDEHWTFNGLVQRFQNLDNRTFQYQRLPQITAAYTNEWHGLRADFGSQFVYFDSLSAAGDKPTGARFTAYPSISLPLTTSFGYITPKIGVHTTSYSLNNNTPVGFSEEFNHLQRTLPIVSLDSSVFFDRQTTIFGTAFTQTLEPRFYYLYIPFRDQRKIPIFDTALTTFNETTLFAENQFAGDDRINNANNMTFAFTSRLIEADSGIERLALTIGQRYNFSNSQVNLPGVTSVSRNVSDLIFGVTARLSNRLNVDTFWQYDPDQSKVQRTNVLLRYNPEPGKSLNVGYRYTTDVLEQINASGQWPLGNGWYGVGRMNYSIRDNKAVESLAGFEYDAGCWQGRAVMQRVETATAKANYAMFFQLELGGLTSIGANPLTVIKRNIPSYMRSGDIPTTYRDQNAE